MAITIDFTKRRTRDKSDKLIESEVYLVRNNGAVVGEAKSREGAERIAASYKAESAPMAEMIFTIEAHTRRTRDKNDKLVIENGFLLRGNDGKFAQYSDKKETLLAVVRKAGGKMSDTRKENPDGVSDVKTPEVKTAQAPQAAAPDVKA